VSVRTAHVSPRPAAAQESLSRQQYSRASDVYMFGMLMYETLTGAEPYLGLSNAQAMECIVRGERPPVPRDDVCGPHIWELLEKCTCLMSEQRPSMDVVLAELDRLLQLPHDAPVAAPAPAVYAPRPAAPAAAPEAAPLPAAVSVPSMLAPAPAAPLSPRPAGPMPTVLEVLLTRPYAAKLNRDTVELLTWDALEHMLTEELVTELVKVEGRGQIMVVLSDLKALVKRYRPGASARALVRVGMMSRCAAGGF
jgi:hypothetical protein